MARRILHGKKCNPAKKRSHKSTKGTYLYFHAQNHEVQIKSQYRKYQDITILVLAEFVHLCTKKSNKKTPCRLIFEANNLVATVSYIVLSRKIGCCLAQTGSKIYKYAPNKRKPCPLIGHSALLRT